MKKFLFVAVLCIMFVTPAFGQSFEKPGLQKTMTVETDGYVFDVSTISNFDITDFEFDKDEKRLTLFINSGAENNLSELQIPKNLINGNFTFLLNENEITTTKVRGNEQISFITIDFEGKGAHKLDIIGTTYLPEFSEAAPLVLATSLFAILLLKRKNFKNLFAN